MYIKNPTKLNLKYTIRGHDYELKSEETKEFVFEVGKVWLNVYGFLNKVDKPARLDTRQATKSIRQLTDKKKPKIKKVSKKKKYVKKSTKK